MTHAHITPATDERRQADDPESYYIDVIGWSDPDPTLAMSQAEKDAATTTLKRNAKYFENIGRLQPDRSHAS